MLASDWDAIPWYAAVHNCLLAHVPGSPGPRLTRPDAVHTPLAIIPAQRCYFYRSYHSCCATGAAAAAAATALLHTCGLATSALMRLAGCRQASSVAAGGEAAAPAWRFLGCMQAARH